MSSFLRGRLNKLYRDTSGTPATPVWSAVTKAEDLAIPMEKDTADISDRDSDFDTEVGVSKKAGLSFSMKWKPDTDPHCLAFWEAFWSDAAVHVKVTDGNVAGEKGVRMICEVTKAELVGPLKGVQKLNVTLSPTDHGGLPPSKVG